MLRVRSFLQAVSLSAAVVASLVLSAGCAQEVGTIDRTQSGLLKKSVFEGEWFMRRTVIETPYDIGYTFVGEQEQAALVTWDVQRDLLIATRVVPFVEGTAETTPVAVFAIKAHVDVIRDYNAATGEQTNVLREDTSDRQWFEREYVRVDWGKNLVTNFNFYIDQLNQEPVAFYVEDGADENSLLLGEKQEDGSWRDVQDPAELREMGDAQYLDVVTRVFVKPEEILIEDYDGTLISEPACWYYLNSDCAPATIGVRNSFLRADVAVSADYEPLHFPDNAVARDAQDNPIRVKWDADGNRERIATALGPAVDGQAGQAGGGGPADPYSSTDQGVVRVDQFDKFGYFRTERFGYDPNYGEVESARVYYINRWNIWDKSRDDAGETLPYAQRATRKITYYLSPNTPATLDDEVENVERQWDRAFRDTVTSLTGTDPGVMFEILPNTRTVDPDTGEVLDRGQALGDLRYSTLWLVDTPLRVGLLGYGPSSIDPRTGEVFQADAYVYYEPIVQLATDGRDTVDLVNGRLDPIQFSGGANVQGYLAGLRTGTSTRQRATRAEIDAFAASHHGAGPGAPAAAKPKKKAKGVPRPSAARVNAMPGVERLKRPAGWAHARLAAVRDTPFEDALMRDPEIMALHGGGRVNPSSTVAGLSAPDRARVSPVRWASPTHRKQQLERVRGFAKRNMLMATFVDDAVAGTALELQDKTPEEIVEILSGHIFQSTSEHEVGHTLGLRHNFEASTDALNFHDHYWELRGDNPVAMAPMTEAEKNGKLREFQYSSIMDYHGRFNTDTAGLGPYDYAAIKFGYGQLVEVFENPPNEPLLDNVDYGEGYYERTFTLDEVLRDYRHYTKIPQMFGGRANISARKDVPYTEAAAALMGQPVNSSIQAQMTGDRPWTDWEVPYRFCSDEYVSGTATCHMFDLGVDSYEIVMDSIERYQAYYWFNNYKRDRVVFDEWDYMDRIWWRYFGYLHNAYQNWVFDQWFTGDTWDFLREDAATLGIEDKPWSESLDGGLAGTAAVMESMKFLNEVIATPEPGGYWFDFDEGYYWAFSAESLPICETEWSYESEDWCSDINFELGDARYFLSQYDVDSGYYFYERLRWVGTFYDKLLALETMTNPDTFFLGINSAESFDEWAISMYSTFPKEMQKIFSGVISDRFDMFAGLIEEENFTFVAPDPFRSEADQTAMQDFGAVDPSTSFTIQLYGLWYGMAYLNANYDNTFNDSAKIWLKGSGEGLEVDPAQLVEFQSPFNQRTYVTIKTDGQGFVGVGQSMLEQANVLLSDYESVVGDPDFEEYYKSRVTGMTENIEVVRGLYDLYGYLYF